MKLKLTSARVCTPMSCCQSARPCSKVFLELTTKESTALAPSTATSRWLFRSGMDWTICFVFPQLSADFDLVGQVRCPARAGSRILGTVDEGAYYESILPNDCESILTKGYESILWMVIRPAVQAAGYQDLLCRQLDTYVHHGELRYGTSGLIKFFFSAAAEREIVSDANEKSSYINLRPTNSLRNITILREFGWLPLHRGAPGMDFPSPGCTSSLAPNVSAVAGRKIPASLPGTKPLVP